MKKKFFVLFSILALTAFSVAFAAEVSPTDESGNYINTEVNSDVTCEDIGLTSTLKRGSRGEQVVILQEILTNAGFYDGEIDGRFGSGTKSAVKMLQDAVSVKADGVLGPVTRDAMREFCVEFTANS